jgi:hypothetical protein
LHWACCSTRTRTLRSLYRRASRWYRRLRRLVSRVGQGRWDGMHCRRLEWGLGLGWAVLGNSDDIQGWAGGMCGSRVVYSLKGCDVHDSNQPRSAL